MMMYFIITWSVIDIVHITSSSFCAAIGLCIIYFSDTIHIMIHMKWYPICINDTFGLVLDKKYLIYPQKSLEFGYFNDQNILNLSKNVSFEVLWTKMNDMLYIV